MCAYIVEGDKWYCSDCVGGSKCCVGDIAWARVRFLFFKKKKKEKRNYYLALLSPLHFDFYVIQRKLFVQKGICSNFFPETVWLVPLVARLRPC